MENELDIPAASNLISNCKQLETLFNQSNQVWLHGEEFAGIYDAVLNYVEKFKSVSIQDSEIDDEEEKEVVWIDCHSSSIGRVNAKAQWMNFIKNKCSLNAIENDEQLLEVSLQICEKTLVVFNHVPASEKAFLDALLKKFKLSSNGVKFLIISNMQIKSTSYMVRIEAITNVDDKELFDRCSNNLFIFNLAKIIKQQNASSQYMDIIKGYEGKQLGTELFKILLAEDSTKIRNLKMISLLGGCKVPKKIIHHDKNERTSLIDSTVALDFLLESILQEIDDYYYFLHPCAAKIIASMTDRETLHTLIFAIRSEIPQLNNLQRRWENNNTKSDFDLQYDWARSIVPLLCSKFFSSAISFETEKNYVVQAGSLLLDLGIYLQYAGEGLLATEMFAYLKSTLELFLSNNGEFLFKPGNSSMIIRNILSNKLVKYDKRSQQCDTTSTTAADGGGNDDTARALALLYIHALFQIGRSYFYVFLQKSDTIKMLLFAQNLVTEYSRQTKETPLVSLLIYTKGLHLHLLRDGLFSTVNKFQDIELDRVVTVDWKSVSRNSVPKQEVEKLIENNNNITQLLEKMDIILSADPTCTRSKEIATNFFSQSEILELYKYYAIYKMQIDNEPDTINSLLKIHCLDEHDELDLYKYVIYYYLNNNNKAIAAEKARRYYQKAKRFGGSVALKFLIFEDEQAIEDSHLPRKYSDKTHVEKWIESFCATTQDFTVDRVDNYNFELKLCCSNNRDAEEFEKYFSNNSIRYEVLQESDQTAFIVSIHGDPNPTKSAPTPTTPIQSPNVNPENKISATDTKQKNADNNNNSSAASGSNEVDTANFKIIEASNGNTLVISNLCYNLLKEKGELQALTAALEEWPANKSSSRFFTSKGYFLRPEQTSMPPAQTVSSTSYSASDSINSSNGGFIKVDQKSSNALKSKINILQSKVHSQEIAFNDMIKSSKHAKFLKEYCEQFNKLSEEWKKTTDKFNIEDTKATVNLPEVMKTEFGSTTSQHIGDFTAGYLKSKKEAIDFLEDETTLQLKKIRLEKEYYLLKLKTLSVEEAELSSTVHSRNKRLREEIVSHSDENKQKIIADFQKVLQLDVASFEGVHQLQHSSPSAIQQEAQKIHFSAPDKFLYHALKHREMLTDCKSLNYFSTTIPLEINLSSFSCLLQKYLEAARQSLKTISFISQLPNQHSSNIITYRYYHANKIYYKKSCAEEDDDDYYVADVAKKVQKTISSKSLYLRDAIDCTKFAEFTITENKQAKQAPNKNNKKGKSKVKNNNNNDNSKLNNQTTETGKHKIKYTALDVCKTKNNNFKVYFRTCFNLDYNAIGDDVIVAQIVHNSNFVEEKNPKCIALNDTNYAKRKEATALIKELLDHLGDSKKLDCECNLQLFLNNNPTIKITPNNMKKLKEAGYNISTNPKTIKLFNTFKIYGKERVTEAIRASCKSGRLLIDKYKMYRPGCASYPKGAAKGYAELFNVFEELSTEKDDLAREISTEIVQVIESTTSSTSSSSNSDADAKSRNVFRILDVGCGNGKLTKLLFERLAQYFNNKNNNNNNNSSNSAEFSNFEVVGVDNQRSCIKRCNALAQEIKNSNNSENKISFYVQDVFEKKASNISGQFNLILVSHFYCKSENITAMIECLKPHFIKEENKSKTSWIVVHDSTTLSLDVNVIKSKLKFLRGKPSDSQNKDFEHLLRPYFANGFNLKDNRKTITSHINFPNVPEIDLKKFFTQDIEQSNYEKPYAPLDKGIRGFKALMEFFGSTPLEAFTTAQTMEYYSLLKELFIKNGGNFLISKVVITVLSPSSV